MFTLMNASLHASLSFTVFSAAGFSLTHMFEIKQAKSNSCIQSQKCLNNFELVSDQGGGFK